MNIIKHLCKRTHTGIIVRSMGLLLLLAMACLAGHAQTEKYLESLTGNIRKDDSCLVTDDKFRDMEKWATIRRHRSVDNLVTFELRYDTSANYFNRRFSCTIQLDIEYEKADHSKQQLKNISLQVNYDTAYGKAHQGIAYYKFKDGHHVKLTVKKISSPEWGDKLPPVFRLKNEIFIDRNYELPKAGGIKTMTAYGTADAANTKAPSARSMQMMGADEINGVPAVNVQGQQASVSWSTYLAPYPEYDFEWTFYDYKSIIGNSVLNQNFVFSDEALEPLFRNNASRVTIKLNTYQLNLVYNMGYVFYRVRGVSYDVSGERVEAEWNYHGAPDYNKNGYGVIECSGHEPLLNWQYNHSFAEEGKRKEVVSYFDGSLRNRQSVTLNNDNNGSATVVQENMYDALGRAAINTLPSPTEDNTIHYFHEFNNSVVSNLPYAYSDIEDPASCVKLPSAMSTSSGASQYYSPANPKKNNNDNYYFSKYIPDAQGYPFAVTRFTPDNTGRVRTQGGVGTVFQPGHAAMDDHTTKYYYGKPQQTELDRLFGNEAGNASHYLKNMVIDANGQTSVSYVNAAGKTVATALSGKTPDNLEALPSYQLKTTPFITVLTDRDNIVRDAANLSLTYSGTFLAAATGNFTLKYEYTPVSLQVLYGVENEKICADCFYDLQINVTDNCGNPAISPVIHEADFTEKTTCDPAPTKKEGEFNISIPQPGEYNITYKLTLSRKAIDYYLGQYLVQNLSLKKETDFQRDYLHQIDVSGCFNNCATCMADLGTETAFVNKLSAVLQNEHQIVPNEDDVNWIKSTYQQLLAECTHLQDGCGKTDAPCQEQAQLIREDVNLGGQYMQYDAASKRFIERDLNSWCLYHNSITGSVTVNGAQRAFNTLTEEEVISNWQDVWADLFVRYHPENQNNCFIDDCSQHASLEAYDRDFQLTDEVQSATDKNYWNKLDYQVVVNNDPYYQSLGYSDQLAFMDKFDHYQSENYQGTPISILDFIHFTLYCPKPSSGVTDNNITPCPATTCQREQDEWILFRGLYNSAKQQFKAAKANASPNACNVASLFQNPLANMQTAMAGNLPATVTCTNAAFFELSTIDIPNTNNATLTVKYNGVEKIPANVRVQYFSVNTTTGATAYAGFVDFAQNSLPDASVSATVQRGFTYVIDYARCDLSHPYYTKQRRNFKNLDVSSLAGDVGSASQASLNSQAQATMTAQCNESCAQNADGWMAKLAGCNLLVTSTEYTQIRDGLIAVCQGSCQVNVQDHPFGASSVPAPTGNGDKNFRDVLLRVLGAARFNNVCNDLLLDYPAPIDTKPVYVNEVVRSLEPCSYNKLKTWKTAYGQTTGYSSFIDFVQKTIDPNFSLTDPEVDNLMTATETNCVTPQAVMLPASLSCSGLPMGKTCLTCQELTDEKANFANAYPYAHVDDPEYYALLSQYVNRKYGFSLSSVNLFNALTQCVASGGGQTPGSSDTVSCAAFTAALQHFEQLKPDYFSNPDGHHLNPDSVYKVQLTMWLNTELNRSLDFDFYSSMAAKCGLTFNLPESSTINPPLDCTGLQTLVSNYKQSVAPNRVMHDFSTQEGEHFNDLHALTHDGFLQLPDTIRQRGGYWYNNYQVTAMGGNFCMTNGYSVESELKFLENDLYGTLFYVNYGELSATFSRYIDFTAGGVFHPQGFYLTGINLNTYSGPQELYGVDFGGAGFDYIQIDSNYFASLSPIKIKAIITPTKYSLLYNGHLIYEHARGGAPIPQLQAFVLGLRGRNGAVGSIRVGDDNDVSRYFEDFNDPDNPALIDPSFICPQPPDCNASFTNYLNTALGTSYTFDQFNDWSWKKCGRHINACCNNCVPDASTTCTPRLITCSEPFTEMDRFKQVFPSNVNARLLALYFDLQRTQWCSPLNLPNIDYHLPYDSLVRYFSNFKLPAAYTLTVQPDSLISYVIDSSATCNADSNMCISGISLQPEAVDLGGFNGSFSQPDFSQLVKENGNYYGFVVNFNHKGISRLNFGSSLLNTPTVTDLGNPGGVLNSQYGKEGIQIVQQGGQWYAIVVGGNPINGSTPKIVRISFGTSIANNTPSGTDWGNVGNMTEPIDLQLVKENGNWYGLTVNAISNSITRFDFGADFSNTPTGTNLGNIGGLNYPCSIHPINDNGTWRAFVPNMMGNNIIRLDFGSSLLNTPTPTNLGNPGGLLNGPINVSLVSLCDRTIGFVVNAGSNEILQCDFPNGLSASLAAVSLGNTGNLNFPHSLSNFMQQGNDLFALVPNVNTNAITRLRFTVSSNPTAVTFQPDPGETVAAQYAICNKPVSPIVKQDENSCINDQIRLAVGNAHTEYQEYMEEVQRDYREAYYTKCLSMTPKLTLTAVYDQPLEYHYTLYYYDQAGNLVKTIPPAGVQPIEDDTKLDRVSRFRLADKDYCYEYGDAPAMTAGSAITVAASPVLQQGAQPFTLEAFMNLSSPGSYQTLLTKQQVNAGDNKTDGYKIYVDADGKLKVDLSGHGQEIWTQTVSKIVNYTYPAYYTGLPPVPVRQKFYVPVTTDFYRSMTIAISSSLSSIISAGQFVHMAITGNGDRTNPIKIYINGNLVNSTVTMNEESYLPGSPPSFTQADINAGAVDMGFAFSYTTTPLQVDQGASAPLVIGGSGDGFTGSIKQVRLYNRVLPASEIRSNAYNTCLVPQSEGQLVLWLPLNREETAGVSQDRINQLSTVNTGTSFSTDYQPLYPPHKMPTHYYYNTLNAVTKQVSPDGGESNFFYDRLGRLVVSQNAEQLVSTRSEPNNRYSYTQYDGLGRITEVGEKTNPSATMTHQIARTDLTDPSSAISNWMASGSNLQVTQTIYDEANTAVVTNASITASQSIYNTTRKRVVATLYRHNGGTTTDYNNATHYQYDINGNVKRLWQEHKTSVTGEPMNLLKDLQYDYDLVSGKVNSVTYQKDKGDQFIYQYNYDPDNRLVSAYSGRDMNTLQQDASYRYYLHGPLARTELGNAGISGAVQGVDYAYTLQGWLKGINGGLLSQNDNAGLDMHTDGSNLSAAGMGSHVAADAIALTLNYYQGDYAAIGGGTLGPAFGIEYQHPAMSAANNTGKQLFNGNISSALHGIAKIDDGKTIGFSYQYDQLNRLKQSKAHFLPNLSSGSGWSNTSAGPDYNEQPAYDANGNITTLVRTNLSQNYRSQDMDNLSYKYYYYTDNNTRKTYQPGMPLPGDAWKLTNQLAHVNDGIPAGNFPGFSHDDEKDIDNQPDNNYTYDGIGNLVKDQSEGMTVQWTVYGKIRSIEKDDGTKIYYDYDASGNRIQKKVTIPAKIGQYAQYTQYTHYIRDAQGNTISVYSWKSSSPTETPTMGAPGMGEANATWDEQHLYGSSRLGLWNPHITVPATLNPTTDAVQVGSKRYELTDHLGNVLSVISDKQIAIPSQSNSSLTDHYEPEVISAQDYYPFGMRIFGRAFNSDSYRYGFNGKENDNEVKGGGDQQDYGMRIYDPRLGRFLSVDPLAAKYPELTPYQFASNRPIDGIDEDGLEFSKYWNRTKVEARAKDLMLNPIKINQAGAGTCSVAAVTYLAILRNKERFYDAVMGLYDNGEAYLGDWIRPNKKLQNTDPAKSPNLSHANYQNESADWIFLSSVQDCQNWFLDFNGTSNEGNAEGNNRSDLKNMMHTIAMYQDVKQEYFNNKEDIKPEQILKGLEAKLENRCGIILEIDAKLIPSYKGTLGKVENHNVAYLGNLQVTHNVNGATSFSFDVQSWGGKQTITCDENKFKEYYKGCTYASE